MANSTQNRFAGIAGGLLEKVLEESISLTQEQAETKREYEAAKHALESATSDVENARRESVRAIDEMAKAKKQEIAKRKENLKNAYHKELIRLGVREEDIPLIERDVVKNADTVAKRTLGVIGRFGKYISDGLKNGTESR